MAYGEDPSRPRFDPLPILVLGQLTTVDPATLTTVPELQAAVREAYASLDAYRALFLLALATAHDLTLRTRHQRDTIARWFHPTPENDQDPPDE